MKTRGHKPRALRDLTGGVRRVAHRTGSAAGVIGPLEPGVRVTGVTGGQFSAIDALEHMVNELAGPAGRADVRISTWTTGIYDVHRARDLRANGRLGDVRFLLDRGTFEKSPKYAGPLIEAMGVEAFRCLSVHAKVIVVEGPVGACAFRSSMNLNKNLRTEQFDVDVSGSVAGFYRGWFDALWQESGRTRKNAAIIEAVYDRWLGEGGWDLSAPETGGPGSDPDMASDAGLDDLDLGDLELGDLDPGGL